MYSVPMTNFTAEVIIPIHGSEESKTIVIPQTSQIQENKKLEI